MNSITLRIVCVLVCAVALLQLGRAETLKGTVMDPTGAVVAGAKVRLSLSGKEVVSTQTDRRGAYALTLNEDPSGSAQTYTLTIDASGFRTFSREITPESNDDLVLVVHLEIATVEESISVEDSNAPFRDELNMGDIRESPAKDLGEALASMDGVAKIRKAGIANDLVIRGFQQNNVNVVIDGARIYGACPGHMDPAVQHVDFAEVDRVEIIKGPFDVEHQGSLGALVNVVTKAPGRGLRVVPSMSFGSSGYYNPSVTGSYGNDRVKLLGGYSYRRSEPYKDGSGRRFTDYANYSITGKGRDAFSINTGWMQTEFAPTKNNRISLSYTRQQAGLVLYPYLTMDANNDNADRASLKFRNRGHLGAFHDPRVELYFTQVKHFMSNDQRIGPTAGTWSMASDASTRTVGGHIAGDIGRDITLGAESYDRNWNVLGYMRPPMPVMNGNPVPDVTTRTIGTFAEYRHSLAERVKLSGGVRFDHAITEVGLSNAKTDLYYRFQNTRSTSKTDNYPSGNIRLTASLSKTVELFAGVGSTGRVPDAEERYLYRNASSGAQVGNPLLPITRNTEVSTGVTIKHGSSYFKPTLFYSKLNDYIIVNNQPQLNAPGAPSMGGMGTAKARSYTNVDARIYGGEISYAVALPAAFSISGGGSYSRGVNTVKPAAGVFSSNLPEMPPLRAWAALRYVRGLLFAEVGGTAANQQGRVDSDLKETRTAGYGVMNAKLGVSYKRLYGSIMIDNLLNRYYYEHLSYYRDPYAAGVKVPEPGRAIFAQLKLTF